MKNTTIALMGIAACAGLANAQQLVALEDFDGGALNLVSSSVPALDGGGGDWFGVGSIGAWPQGTGVPFSLTDDSVVDLSGGGVFPADNEGVFGMNRNVNDAFFAMSDSDEFGSDQTASWTFDISGLSDISLAIDFGGISNDSFDGYSTNTSIAFTVSIDGGASQTAFSISAVDNTGQFTTRLMDSGMQSGGGRLLEVTGDQAVSKIDALTGLEVADTFSDKATVETGEMDTFLTSILGTGSQLTITLNADLPFEAAAFDNIALFAVPTPGAMALLGLGGAFAARRRR